MANTITEQVPISGMTCTGCERQVSKVVLALPGVKSVQVSYRDGVAAIVYDKERVNRNDIDRAIEKAGYAAVKKEHMGGIAIVTLAVCLLLRQTGILQYTTLFPTAQAGMEYGMLFVIGLLTSVHCVAMCGGINLSQCIPGGAKAGGTKAALRPGVLYNLGRVLSYTVVGAVVGGLGSVLSLSVFTQGVLQLGAGLFMVLMGVNMLGLFPTLRRLVPRLPGSLGVWLRGHAQGGGPLAVGLLNGLMPCGPLQAMQLYALSTGHPLKGALAMLLFSLGTVPLMLGLSIFGAVMSRRMTRRVMTAGAVLVAVLGVSMLQNGLALTGMTAVSGAAASPEVGAPALQEGVQVVRTRLSPYGYPAITVEAGTPVRWVITAERGTVTGCNNRMYIPEYGIEKQLVEGENVIEFTPQETGVFPYSCWMGMIRSAITVTEEGELPEGAQAAEPVSPRIRL